MKKLLILSLIILSACTFQTRHRGYVFPSDLDAVVADVKTTSQLMDKIGAPLAKTMYGDTVWIYYGVDENYRGPLAMTYDNKTVLLAWVKNNRVTDIKILRDADLPDVVVADAETQIPAAIELNAVQELFNNIGRFTPAGLGQ